MSSTKKSGSTDAQWKQMGDWDDRQRRAKRAAKKERSRLHVPTRDPGSRALRVGDAVQLRFEPETGGIIETIEHNSRGESEGWARVKTSRGLRRVPIGALRLSRYFAR